MRTNPGLRLRTLRTPEGITPADFGFTGEQTASNGNERLRSLYLRARYYDPATGVFTALDPFEGTMQRPMSMNGYSWVEGNTSALSVANP